MKIHVTEKLGRAARELRSRFVPRGLILMYHRVAEVHPDPWSLCVSPDHFSEHLEVIRKHFRPMKLPNLAKALGNRKVPGRSVVITFDDGYADNLHYAKRLLERYDIPSSVFITTGYIDDNREFWWDELERLILHSNTLPERLQLNINGKQYEWQLSEADLNIFELHKHYPNWRAWDEAPSPRHHLYSSLWELLQPLSEVEQRKVLNDLQACTKTEQVVRTTHRPLSHNELEILSQCDLIEIGAHSVTHPNFQLLPLASQREEIYGSKAYLEKLTGSPVTSFCYPYGSYTLDTVAIVSQAGFSCACAVSEDIVRLTTDRFQLPRFHIRDWNGDELARKLSGWFNS